LYSFLRPERFVILIFSGVGIVSPMSNPKPGGPGTKHSVAPAHERVWHVWHAYPPASKTPLHDKPVALEGEDPKETTYGVIASMPSPFLCPFQASNGQ
jgi:hypothetical protein